MNLKVNYVKAQKHKGKNTLLTYFAEQLLFLLLGILHRVLHETIMTYSHENRELRSHRPKYQPQQRRYHNRTSSSATISTVQSQESSSFSLRSHSSMKSLNSIKSLNDLLKDDPGLGGGLYSDAISLDGKEDIDKEALRVGIILSLQESKYGVNMFESITPDDEIRIEKLVASGISRDAAALAIFERKYGSVALDSKPGTTTHVKQPKKQYGDIIVPKQVSSFSLSDDGSSSVAGHERLHQLRASRERGLSKDIDEIDSYEIDLRKNSSRVHKKSGSRVDFEEYLQDSFSGENVEEVNTSNG